MSACSRKACPPRRNFLSLTPWCKPFLDSPCLLERVQVNADGIENVLLVVLLLCLERRDRRLRCLSLTGVAAAAIASQLHAAEAIPHFETNEFLRKMP